MKHLSTFKIFERLNHDYVEVRDDCMDIFLELKDKGFNIEFQPFTGGYGYLDLSLPHYLLFNWHEAKEEVERLIEYCNMKGISLEINGNMLKDGRSVLFEFEDGSADAILEYNDTEKFPEVLISIISFKLF